MIPNKMISKEEFEKQLMEEGYTLTNLRVGPGVIWSSAKGDIIMVPFVTDVIPEYVVKNVMEMARRQNSPS